MQSFLAIKNNIQKRRNSSKKWRLLYYALYFLVNINLIVHFLKNDIPLNWPLLDLFNLITLLFSLYAGIRLFSQFIFFHRIDQIVNKEEIKVLELTGKSNIDEWFAQNKNLIAVFISLPPYISKKKPNHPWGIINSEGFYHMVFIDFSKKNDLIILNIQKSEINQYSEAETIEQVIYEIKSKVKKIQRPMVRQLGDPIRFFSN